MFGGLGVRVYVGLELMVVSGWCYSLLTLSGKLVIIGSLECVWMGAVTRTAEFPVPDTKVYQHSSGRQHLLALSERGEVWHISSANSEVPLLITFAELDITLGYPGDKPRQPRTVSKVVAGWAASGVLVEGYGIAVWLCIRPQEGELYVKDVPFLSRLSTIEDADAVVDFAIGENYLVAATASGKVFAANMGDIEREEPIAPMQMLNFEAPAGQSPINRVVGWFRKFALFNKNGLVHIFDDQDLETSRQHLAAAGGPRGLSRTLNEMKTDAVAPTAVAGLEEYNIVDVAFGDWHCLALTDTGKVLSWGRESSLCGCLGLGQSSAAKARGLRVIGSDGILDTAQVVSFQHPYPETKGENDSTFPLITHYTSLTHTDTTEYAYKIAAAGWHSCALVAVVDKGTTLSAGGVPRPLAVDGSADSKHKLQNDRQPPADPKSPQPSVGRGHRGGIEDVPSDARGGNGSLAEASIATGGRSLFELGTSAKQSSPPPPLPSTERGHRGGIVGMRSDARGGSSSLVEASMARGGQSFFGMTGGALQLGEGDRLSESGEREKEEKRKHRE